jgi:hypothetical protein
MSFFRHGISAPQTFDVPDQQIAITVGKKNALTMPFLHVTQPTNGEGSFPFRFVASVKTGAI